MNVHPSLLLAFVLPIQSLPAQGTPDSSASGVGYFSATMNVDSFFVVIDDDYRNPHFVRKGDTIAVLSGLRKVIIAAKNTWDKEFKVVFEKQKLIKWESYITSFFPEGSMEGKTSYYRIMRKRNLVVVTDDDSEILINGTSVGKGYAVLDTTQGRYKVATRHALAGSTEQEVTVANDRIRSVEMYNKPDKIMHWSLSIVPGLGQLYKRQTVKGVLFLAAGGAAFAESYLAQQSFRKENESYLSLAEQYTRAATESEAARLAEEAQTKLDAARKNARLRDAALIAGGILWVLNAIDSLGEPESGYRIERALVGMQMQTSAQSLSFTFSIPLN